MSKKHLAVINIVGLTQGLINKKNTPFIFELLKTYHIKALEGVFPSVTTTAQSAMLTGKTASEHGIVGNGWYFKDLAEIGFWKQANHLVQSPRVWEALKENYNDFTCANSFWWYNMYSSTDYSVTPRPHYPADGRKIPDLYSSPSGLHQELEESLGKFPFFNFWGPKAGIESSTWIANSAIEIQKKHKPNLHLIYLPHLDYNLQKLEHNDPEIVSDLRKIDDVVKNLCQQLLLLDTEFMLVSEYGIRPVNKPIEINRLLRKHGYLAIRKSLGTDMLDCGASKAFAAVDHQIAHVYVNDKSKMNEIKLLLANENGIEQVVEREQMDELGVDHERAGDLIVIAEPNAWFVYYYWLDDVRAPDFARTIDIHRKPGYDPLEMFLNPDIPCVKGRVLWKLLMKKMGFRSLVDVIPLKPELIKGSHGRLETDCDYQPILISRIESANQCNKLTDIYSLIKGYFE